MKFVAAYRDVAHERHFLKYFAGESISSLGDAMSEVTIVVLALSLGEGKFQAIAVAVASAAYLAPGILTGMLGSRRLSHLSPKKLLLLDNLWRGTFIGAAAILATANLLELWTYVGLLALASLTRPWGAAGSRGIVAQIVRPQHLFAANSLISSSVQTATMFGPALAGVLIAAVGTGPALLLDAISFLGFASLLITIRRASPDTYPAGSAESDPDMPVTTAPFRFRQWLQYRPVLILFTITGIMVLLYGPFVVSLPILAQERAGSLASATVLGLLWSGFGVGAVVGGLLQGANASLATIRAAALISAGWGFCTLVMGLPGPIVLCGAAMVLGGFIYAPYNAIVSTVMQHTLPERRLAEASAYLESIKGITLPLGLMAGGGVILAVGASATLILSGALLTGIGLVIATRTKTALSTTPEMGPAEPGEGAAYVADEELQGTDRERSERGSQVV